MYLSSALYHVLLENRAKRVFRVLDHGTIFLLIGGHVLLSVARNGAEAVDMWGAQGNSH